MGPKRRDLKKKSGTGWTGKGEGEQERTRSAVAFLFYFGVCGGGGLMLYTSYTIHRGGGRLEEKRVSCMDSAACYFLAFIGYFVCIANM